MSANIIKSLKDSRIAAAATGAVIASAAGVVSTLLSTAVSWTANKVYVCVAAQASYGLCKALQELVSAVHTRGFQSERRGLRRVLFHDGLYRISCASFSGFVHVSADCFGVALGDFASAQQEPPALFSGISSASEKSTAEGAKPHSVYFYVRRRYLPQLQEFIQTASVLVQPSVRVTLSSPHYRILETFLQEEVSSLPNVNATVLVDAIETKLLLNTSYEVTFPDGKAVVARMLQPPRTNVYSRKDVPKEFELTYANDVDKEGSDVRQRLLVSLQGLHAVYASTPSLKIMAFGADADDFTVFGRWNVTEEVAARALTGVYLDGGIKEDLVADIVEFRNSGEWYAQKRIPFRRGYLLHGPPGTGKTTFIQAIANHFRLNVCRIVCTATTTDAVLMDMFRTAPANSVILLEDVDRLFPENAAVEAALHAFEGSAKTARGVVTMSGLLRALDGAATTTCRIVFLTTNHIGRLDEALVRCGRCDKKVLLDYASPRQLQAMFSDFYPEADGALCAAFLEILRDVTCLTLAQVQEHFIVHKHSAQHAYDNVYTLIDNAMAAAAKIDK